MNDSLIAKIKASNGSDEKTVHLVSVDWSEEDLRKKSAKIQTNTFIDITENRWDIRIYHSDKLIFGGVLLNSDYDEKNGLYTYQCQGYQRWLTTKGWLVVDDTTEQNILYDVVKKLCEDLTGSDKTTKGEQYTKQFSSYYLAPKDEYECYPTVDDENKVATNDSEATGMDTALTVFYEDKTLEETLTSLLVGNNVAVDLYADDKNCLRIEPLKLDEWNKPNNIYLTTRNLSGYSFKTDASNVVTNVSVKNTDIYKNHIITNPQEFTAEDLGFSNLSYYFGKLNVFVSNNTQTTVSTSDDSEESTETVTQSTVDNTVENEKLARAKITEGLRNLMSFEIEYEGVIDELHTNSFIWFELPRKHILSNYANIVGGVDRTTTRGGEYVLNRYYVEKISISYKDKSLTSKITLNPFASDLSSYSKTYTDAIDKYNQANCQSSSSSTGATGSGYNKFGISADGSQIMAIGMPSACADSKYAYKFYKRVFKNYCPSCKSNDLVYGWAWGGEGKTGGTFPNAIDGKSHRYVYGRYKSGAYEGHIFCANCDADFSCVSGQDHWSCSTNRYLTPVTDAEASSKDEARKLINGEYSNGGATTSSTVTSSSSSDTSSDTSTSCTSSSSSDTTGSYEVGENVKQLANQLTSSKNADTIMKECLKFKYGVVSTNFYIDYTNFCCEPNQCLIRNPKGNRKGANCCDGTRLYFHMVAYKGVATSELQYRHIYGHIYGRYKNTDYDWVKGGTVGIHWGSGRYMSDTTFPKQPFACGGKYDSDLESNGFKSFDERLNEYIEDYIPYEDCEFDDAENLFDKGRQPFGLGGI